MRRVGVLAAAAVVATLGCRPTPTGPPPPDLDRARVLAHLTELTVAIGPRPDGSEPALRAAQYIDAQLHAMGAEVDRFPIGTVPRPAVVVGGTTVLPFQLTTSGNDDLVARFGPAAGPALLVMAHYDTVDVSPGANDDAAAVAVSLELARALTVAPPPRPVVIAFTGGEELGLLGARRLAALVAAGDLPPIDVAIALDLVGSDGPLVINGAGDLVREPELRWLAAAARSPAPAASARVRRASGPRRDPSHRGASGTRGRPARPRDRAGRGARRGCLAR